MAVYHLRLTPEQFFGITPRQLHLLLDRHREHVQFDEWRTGLLAAVMANFSLAAPKKPLAPSDFMPSFQLQQRKPSRRRRPSRTAIASNIRCFLLSRIAAQRNG